MSDSEKKPKSEPTNKVSYNCLIHDISSVTVYQSKYAEVKRDFVVSLKAGQNDIEISNLTSCLEKRSIRVDGIENAIIFDVTYHSPPSRRKFDPKAEEFKDLKERKEKITSEINIVNRQSEVLSDFSKTLSSKDASTEKLDSFLDLYATRQATIDERKAQLEEDLVKVTKELEDKKSSFDVSEDVSDKRGVRVTIVVLANVDGDAKLSLTYLVSSASWTPIYDIRAKIANDKESESTVTLHYRASISQMTGESWKGVNLTLSTASPLIGTYIPSLEPLRISEKHTRYSARKFVLASVSGPSDTRTAHASEDTIRATFAIPGLSTIPTDWVIVTKTNRVSIAELVFTSVDFEWVAVPKEAPGAFLRCKVKNASAYVLLPGEANVFVDGDFVARTQIPLVSPQQTFACMLGADPALRVTYHPRATHVKAAGAGQAILSLTGKSSTSTTTVEQAITVRNTRRTRVRRLLLRDQVPVSAHSAFKVNLLEPRVLAAPSGKGGKGALGSGRVAEGVSAQWMSKREDEEEGGAAPEELTMESAHGLLQWVIDMEPEATVDVKVAWDVVAAGGEEWVMTS